MLMEPQGDVTSHPVGRQDGRCSMHVMTPQHGDFRMTWDPDKPDEVAAAKEQFEKFRKKGYWAYKVNRLGNKGEVVTSFDPEAEKLIMAPQVSGG